MCYCQKLCPLLDSGSIENILSKRLFDTLPQQIRTCLHPLELSAHLADDSNLIIYGTIDLCCRLCTIPFTTTFKVANITIRGMRFFQKNQASLHLAQGTLEIGNQVIACVDRVGQDLVSKVQITHTTTLPSGQEALITCRVTSAPPQSVGLIEHFPKTPDNMVIAAPLSKLDKHHRVTVRCLNTQSTPLLLKAGTVIGLYTPVQDKDIHTSTTTHYHSQQS